MLFRFFRAEEDMRINPLVLDFNAKLKPLAIEFDYTYLDLYSIMKDEKGELREDWTGDGLHLKPPAYEAWKKEIDKLLGAIDSTDNPKP